MSERLVPFDWDAFVADPSRLRYPGCRAPDWVEIVPRRRCIVALFSQRSVYPALFTLPQDSPYLRLVHKPKTVAVRLYRERSGHILAACTPICSLDHAPAFTEWVSGIFEIEVAE